MTSVSESWEEMQRRTRADHIEHIPNLSLVKYLRTMCPNSDDCVHCIGSNRFVPSQRQCFKITPVFHATYKIISPIIFIKQAAQDKLATCIIFIFVQVEKRLIV